MNPTPQDPPNTVRALAKLLRVSPTTVSEALRGVPRVARATAERVRTAATLHGYRRNPIAGAVMAEMRRSRAAHYRGTLALLELAEAERPSAGDAFSRALRDGAERRSRELGFTMDRFVIGAQKGDASRLNSVLSHRGIVGVIVLPTFTEAHLEAIAWDGLAAVYLDRVIRFPALHSVSTDHHSAMWLALAEAEKLGYRRAGLVLRTQQDERLQNRWEGAFLAYAQTRTRLELAPMLIAPKIDAALFRRWLRAQRPDVVLGHDATYVDWMQAAGRSVPARHGFIGLNAAMCDRPCAAIDQQPLLIGARGAELVIGQLLRGEGGVPENPCHSAVPARFVAGPTVRVLAGETGGRPAVP